jgi:hypothetical protein
LLWKADRLGSGVFETVLARPRRSPQGVASAIFQLGCANRLVRRQLGEDLAVDLVAFPVVPELAILG